MIEITRQRGKALRLAAASLDGGLWQDWRCRWRPTQDGAERVASPTVAQLVGAGLLVRLGPRQVCLTEAGHAHACVLAAEARLGERSPAAGHPCHQGEKSP